MTLPSTQEKVKSKAATEVNRIIAKDITKNVRQEEAAEESGFIHLIQRKIPN